MHKRQSKNRGSAEQESVQLSIESADIVIIGNGIAGLTAAVEARRHDPDARIVIVTDQNHPTINTPALKQFAIGKLNREQLLAYPVGTERTQRIHVMNAHVSEIHAQRKFLSLSGSRSFGYGSLLIATGSSPMGLGANIPGRDFDGVLTLHRMSDYLDLRRRLGEVEEAVVIGGGVHAIETVMGLMHCGVKVHWLIRGETFLAKMLDQPASQMVLEHARRSGVKVYTSTEAVGIVGRIGSVAGVVTNHNQMIPCQLVLTCTGTKPVSTLARQCTVPMQQKNGILVNDKLRTSVRDIYAAGDVAALRNPQTGEYEPRAQWYAAVLQGRMAGAMMTGQEPAAQDPFGVRWHATLLGELSMLTVGDPLNWSDGIMTLTDSSRNAYRRITVMGDRLVGYLSLGSAQPDSLSIKRIIDEGLSIRDVKKELLKGAFDARRYFSQQRSYIAQGMVKTGRAQSARTTDPVPMPGRLPKIPAQVVSRAPATESLESQPLVTVTGPLRQKPQMAAPFPQAAAKPYLVADEWEEIGIHTDRLSTYQAAEATEYVPVSRPGAPLNDRSRPQRGSDQHVSRKLWAYAEDGE